MSAFKQLNQQKIEISWTWLENVWNARKKKKKELVWECLTSILLITAKMGKKT